MTRLVLFAAFVATVFAANALTQRYGMVPVGFGLMATAGTYAAGLAFGLRDALHESAGRRWRVWVVAAIVIGAAASALVAPSLALASGVAFLVSESADLAVYEPLRRRSNKVIVTRDYTMSGVMLHEKRRPAPGTGRWWVAAVIASGIVGALIDTLLFLWLAPFPVTGPAVAGQMVGKGLMVAIAIPIVWGVRRAVPRYRLDRAGA